MAEGHIAIMCQNWVGIQIGLIFMKSEFLFSTLPLCPTKNYCAGLGVPVITLMSSNKQPQQKQATVLTASIY